MRIAFEQLEHELQHGLAPLYVVQGDELYIANTALDAIRRAARDRGYLERVLLDADGRFDWSRLREAGASLSLFATRRLIEIRLPGGKPGIEGAAALQEYITALPPDTITLVSLPKLDRQSQQSKWYKALETKAALIAAHPVKREQLPQWLAARLKTHGQTASRAALEFLAEQLEGNLLAAAGEIEKFALLYPQRELTFDEIRAAAANLARFDVFEFGDALLSGEPRRIATMLASLRAAGVEPTLVLWVIAREGRLLALLGERLARGESLRASLREMRVWDARMPLIERAVARLPRSAVLAELREAARADRIIKGVADGEVWSQLEQLALAFCAKSWAPTRAA